LAGDRYRVGEILQGFVPSDTVQRIKTALQPELRVPFGLAFADKSRDFERQILGGFDGEFPSS
jgi:hypothetical protein